MAKNAPSKKTSAATPVASKKETVKKKAAPSESAPEETSTLTPEETSTPEEAPTSTPEETSAPEAKATPAVKTAAAKKAAAGAKAATPKGTAVEKTEEVATPVVKTASAPARAESVKTSKPAAKQATPVKPPLKKRIVVKRRPVFSHLAPPPLSSQAGLSKEKAKKLTPAFLKSQRQKLLDLRDTLLDQMSGVTRDSLGSNEGGDSSAFGMHQADAGSDSYDRDFALSILSQEQNALYEIDEALVRLDGGDYGICVGSGEAIPIARLEAMPFARCTVEYQEKLDLEQASGNFRAPVTSLFGLEEKEVSKASDDEED